MHSKKLSDFIPWNWSRIPSSNVDANSIVDGTMIFNNGISYSRFDINSYSLWLASLDYLASSKIQKLCQV